MDGSIITDDHGTIDIGGDLRVRRMGYGAMRLCGEGIWGPPADPHAALDLLRDAVGWGANLIDTADAYGPEVNEEQIAQALHPYPDDLVIATKGGIVRPSQYAWPTQGDPDHLKAACEASLRRLRLDTIPLYQLHAPDPEVPFEESVGALADLRDAGKVRNIGLSNVSLDQLRTGRTIADIASVQNDYNLLDRQSDDVLEACTEAGIAFLPYRPLAGGRIQESTSSALAGVAERMDVTAAQVGLAWLLHISPVVIPIPGTADHRHLAENLEAGTLRLDAADVAAIGDSAH